MHIYFVLAFPSSETLNSYTCTYSCDEDTNRNFMYLMGQVLYARVFDEVVKVIQTYSNAVYQVIMVLERGGGSRHCLKNQRKVRQRQSEIVPCVSNHYYVVIK